jgi:hypothetical protein
LANRCRGLAAGSDARLLANRCEVLAAPGDHLVAVLAGHRLGARDARRREARLYQRQLAAAQNHRRDHEAGRTHQDDPAAPDEPAHCEARVAAPVAQ